MKNVGSRKRAQPTFDVYWKILEVQVKCIHIKICIYIYIVYDMHGVCVRLNV